VSGFGPSGLMDVNSGGGYGFGAMIIFGGANFHQHINCSSNGCFKITTICGRAGFGLHIGEVLREMQVLTQTVAMVKIVMEIKRNALQVGVLDLAENGSGCLLGWAEAFPLDQMEVVLLVILELVLVQELVQVLKFAILNLVLLVIRYV